MKWCNHCKCFKDMSEFSTNQYYCKLCKKEYYQNSKEATSEHQKEYRKNNRKKIKKYNKEYYIKNKRCINEQSAKYYQNNKKRIDKKTAEYKKNKCKINPQFRLVQNIKRAIHKALKGNKNGRHWEDTVDFTQQELRKHLEKQFTQGMTWDNYGKWHIDHKIPISVFNFDSSDQLDFKKCWALSNLKPMWAKENIRKYNKIDKPFQPCLRI